MIEDHFIDTKMKKKFGIGIYVAVVLGILFFSFFGNKSNVKKHIPLSEINATDVNHMIISVNGRKYKENRFNKIDDFIRIIKTCTGLAEEGKGRVEASYKVALKINDDEAVFNFKKSKSAPLTIDRGIMKPKYVCNQVEWFFNINGYR